ncbi:Uncharacterised protein [Mycobacteroides abscessus subsp. abscessus]|uniref:Uncharacterized protein n=1 Tax=Mycobacteroides abscessus (strain ATCC 19977 / DSM 44196 / CCUG 20993 / CIP 104536 / JCM 13569 / NCTC 13031 / TMC 1543 / L948) TaxID=561007 RepID=B1MBR1_MYCA9|nr:Hypothetical protein MAB_2601 [Mycobacteroides abscessus ATCC 19977]SHY03606.1 Uncharacterised protein [Mycobacteroides abscessus subsp. abscessus]
MSASEKLWMVSAANATDPDTTTMATWKAAVISNATRLILTARVPAALALSASSMLSAASWLCGVTISASSPLSPAPC